MKEKFSTQDIIDMVSMIYDSGNFMPRESVHKLLMLYVDNGLWDATEDTVSRVFDLIVG